MLDVGSFDKPHRHPMLNAQEDSACVDGWIQDMYCTYSTILTVVNSTV